MTSLACRLARVSAKTNRTRHYEPQSGIDLSHVAANSCQEASERNVVGSSYGHIRLAAE